MQINREDMYEAAVVIDPVSLAVFADKTSDQPSELIWISRLHAKEPGKTIQLLWRSIAFVTMMRYNQDKSRYEGVGHNTMNDGRVRPALSWMSERGRTAYFLLSTGEEKSGWIMPKMGLRKDIIYNFLGWGPFKLTEFRDSIPVFMQVRFRQDGTPMFVAQKTSNE